MVGHIKEKMKYFYYVFLALVFWGCANQLPPGGGEIDLVPPQIVKIYPENGTINFNSDYIEIDFSKYVEHRTFKDALFISPAVDGELEFEWTGKSVRVYFPQKLKQNITYVVSVGSDLQDYNNHNRMAESYSFAFSTGNKIDRGSINGKIFADKPSGIMLFAYLKSDSVINPMTNKPDYISQAGKDGSYRLLGLKSGGYRVFAVKDEYRDLIYQPEQDEIGIPYKDIKLTDQDTLFAGLNFFISKFDTVKPRMINAVMTDEYHILLNFSKDIDTSMIKSSNFLITDSTSGKSFVPNYAFKGNTKPTEMVLVTDKKFPVKDEVFVLAKNITDKYGNIFHADDLSLTLSDKPDTTKPGIAIANPPAGTSDADFVGQIYSFSFNDAFDSLSAKQGITFSDTSGKFIPYNIRFLDDASFIITPGEKLEPNTNYLIKLDLTKFSDLAGNKYDSLYQYKFKTINGLDFTGVSGNVGNLEPGKNIYLLLQSFDKNNSVYSEKLKKNLTFNFNRVLPGKYKLWCFDNVTGSDTYDYGKAYPYKPSERFWVYPDTLNLKARWIQTNINFDLKR